MFRLGTCEASDSDDDPEAELVSEAAVLYQNLAKLTVKSWFPWDLDLQVPLSARIRNRIHLHFWTGQFAKQEAQKRHPGVSVTDETWALSRVLFRLWKNQNRPFLDDPMAFAISALFASQATKQGVCLFLSDDNKERDRPGLQKGNNFWEAELPRLQFRGIPIRVFTYSHAANRWSGPTALCSLNLPVYRDRVQSINKAKSPPILWSRLLALAQRWRSKISKRVFKMPSPRAPKKGPVSEIDSVPKPVRVRRSQTLGEILRHPDPFFDRPARFSPSVKGHVPDPDLVQVLGFQRYGAGASWYIDCVLRDPETQEQGGTRLKYVHFLGNEKWMGQLAEVGFTVPLILEFGLDHSDQETHHTTYLLHAADRKGLESQVDGEDCKGSEWEDFADLPESPKQSKRTKTQTNPERVQYPRISLDEWQNVVRKRSSQ